MRTRLNNIYQLMKQRCYNPNNPRYKDYGGRNIIVCDEWVDTEIIHLGRQGRLSKGWLAFKEWAISNGYKDNLTLDRIDNNKGYCPENCRWVSMQVQINNTRQNHNITYKGDTKTLRQWADVLGISYSTLRSRLNRDKMSVEEALEGKKCQR